MEKKMSLAEIEQVRTDLRQVLDSIEGGDWFIEQISAGNYELRCRYCHSPRIITVAAARTYLSRGWPVCCDETMLLDRVIHNA